MTGDPAAPVGPAAFTPSLSPDDDGLPQVDVVTVCHNGGGLLTGALESFAASSGVRVRSIVVDNASADGSPAEASRLGALVDLVGENIGYGAAFNRGLRLARAEFVVCANQDVQVRPDTLERLVAAVKQHDETCGVPCVVGARLVTAAGETGETCHRIPTLREQTVAMLLGEGVVGARNAFPDSRTTQHCGWVSAAFVLARREVFADLGGFDPAYFMYVEDLELFSSLAERGGHCLWVPEAEVVHLRSGGGIGTPGLHAHTLWNWKLYFTRHGRHAGSVAGSVILGAGIVGSLLRGVMWWCRARTGGQDRAAERATIFLRGGILALVCGLRRRPPPLPM